MHSHAPLLFSERWCAGSPAGTRARARDRLAMLRTFRLGHLAPVSASAKGLTDPIVGGQLMGQTAENLA